MKSKDKEKKAAAKPTKQAKVARAKKSVADAKARQKLPSRGTKTQPSTARTTKVRSVDPRVVLVEEPEDISAHKFDLAAGATPEPARFELPEYEDLGELPAKYGTGKLFLVARDPQWLYAYWDLTYDQLAEAQSRAHDGKLFLELRKDGSRIQQIQISAWSHDWYLHAPQAGSGYLAEIGYYRGDGGFEVVARSSGAPTPPDAISWKTQAKFVTIPFHYSFKQLRDLIARFQQPGEDLGDTLARLQEEGFPFPFEVPRPPGMSEDAYVELLSYLGAVTIRRIQQGSGEIIELLRKNLLDQFSTSSGQWISSISSPFGSSFGAGDRGFFMDVNAELIIYGGTHPQATVRIDGEKIQLTPDGRFSYHFNFKDGKFHIPIDALSPDGVETRSALLSFLRLTALDPGVEPTPQETRPTPLGEID
ncbi:MAG: DUF4912 domain-containing protein [Candidatus Methylacidiphilales bacterium]|nr:DUF4912 domain-containing protein [Candidatus Methylacidiphilales bacterium]